MKRRERRTIEPNDGAYARPQARAVRRRKNERRYVKDGSGRCHVFFVSIVPVGLEFAREEEDCCHYRDSRFYSSFC
jgi:hypothetical protein